MDANTLNKSKSNSRNIQKIIERIENNKHKQDMSPICKVWLAQYIGNKIIKILLL